MRYESLSDDDRRFMLGVLGLESIDDLFEVIPPSLRQADLGLAPGLSEPEVWTTVESLASTNRSPGPESFLGAGCYSHYVPAAVRALTSRGEFATAYTPYQAEVSQGTLQYIFEFQSCVCELTGMEVANASLYDGPSALAEAAFMASRVTRREGILVSSGVHPEAVQVVATYAAGPNLPVWTWPLDPRSGATVTGARHPPDIDRRLPSPHDSIAAVLVQQPNYLGVVEDLRLLADAAHAAGALLVVATNPMTLGILESPGSAGADIAVGDVQVFGNAASFGGASAGFLACREAQIRQIPGRLVGQTVDEDGRTCYTLTLQAREQHIRRAKATSNICSNQSLNALAATIYLSLLGPQGLRRLGEICVQRAHHLHAGLCSLPGVEPLAAGPFFHEFALNLPCSAEYFRSAMRVRGVDPGVPLSRLLSSGPSCTGAPATNLASPSLGPIDNVLLVAVTESNPPEALDLYLAVAGEVLDQITSPSKDGPR